MECQDMLELLSASLDGELTEAEQAQLNAHLDTCPSCRALYEELSGLHAACDLETEAPAELTARILGSLPPQPSGKVVYWRRWGAMAAAVVLIALAAWRLPQHLSVGMGSDSTKPEASEEDVTLTAAMMDETAPAEAGAIIQARTADTPSYGAFMDRAPIGDAGSGDIDDAPAAEQAPVPGPQDLASPTQLPVNGRQGSMDAQRDPQGTDQFASKKALSVSADIAPSAVLFTSGMAPVAGGGEKMETPEAFDEPSYQEVPEDVPDMAANEMSIAAVPFEDLAEDIRDFSSYRYVLTLSQADFAQDYPRQFQPGGEMWYLVPLEVLEALPQTLAQEDPLYALRDQGEDLDADSPYVLVVVPPAP